MKKILYLVRHASSSLKLVGNAKDIDRPLTEAGDLEAEHLGLWMQAQDIFPDTIITSPARRARMTTDIISRVLGYPRKQITEEVDLYNAEVAFILSIIHELADNITSAMIIGHNPGLTSTAHLLSTCQLDILSTASICGLVFPLDDWRLVDNHTGDCLFFEKPGTVY